MPDSSPHEHNLVQIGKAYAPTRTPAERLDHVTFHIYGCACGLLTVHPRAHFERTTPAYQARFLALWAKDGFTLDPPVTEPNVPRAT